MQSMEFCLSLLQGSSQHRNQTQVSRTVGKFFTSWTISKVYDYTMEMINRFEGLDVVRQSAWRIMDGGLQHCRGGSDQNHPKEKEIQEGKVIVWEGLTNSWEKKRRKRQRRKGRYHTPLNAEFQRIARRDKKAFLSEQCKEIEENNRMGKTRDFFKKTGDTKGTFHARMASIKEEIVRT